MEEIETDESDRDSILFKDTLPVSPASKLETGTEVVYMQEVRSGTESHAGMAGMEHLVLTQSQRSLSETLKIIDCETMDVGTQTEPVPNAIMCNFCGDSLQDGLALINHI